MATLQQFRNLLFIQRHRLDEELEIQPHVQDTIATELAQRNTAMLEAKDTLASVEARLFLQYKEDKVANETANAEVKLHRERITAWQRYQEARQTYEMWQGLHAAWVSRGYNIKTLSELYTAQYFAIDSTRRIDRDEPNALRKQLREASGWAPPSTNTRSITRPIAQESSRSDPPAPVAPIVRRRTLT